MITCIFENSKKTSLRHVVVDAIIARDDHSILLVKRAPHLLNGNKYAIPGGFVERDETIEQALIREVYEETGLRGEIQYLFRIKDQPNRRGEERQNIGFVYVVKVEPNAQTQLNNEVTEIKWFAEDYLPQEDDFAFDHREDILFFLKHLKQSFKLPLIG